jgi:1-acyl-sn-glycerol-3-phosphate acyltransferase
MNVLAVISPGLKVLVERVGKPEIVNRPNLFRSGGAGAVIACNHVGWADGLWMAYAVYPRQLRYMSKEELFDSTLSRLVLTHGGSLPINRADPSPSSIKTAVDMLQHGEIILIFPSGTRSEENIAFKRGRCDYRTSRPGSTCARLLSRPEADASRASPAPTSHTGDIRITDPNSGAAVWEGNDD